MGASSGSPGQAVNSGLRFPGLDGLRGLAVLGILLHTAGVPGFASGQLGIEVFFVLSGFFLTVKLLAHRDATKRIGAGRFFVRRAARWLPALCLMLAVVTAYTFSGCAPWSGPDLVAGLGPALVERTGSESPAMQPPLDHLAVLAWGLVAVLGLPPVLGWAGRTWIRMRWLSRACVAFFALSAAIRVLPAAAAPALTGALERLAASRLDGFGIGVLCALALRRGIFISRRWVMLALPIVLACFPLNDPPWKAAVGASLVVAATGVLILGAAGARASRFMHALDVAPLAWLGTVSWGAFLWHQPVWLVLQHRGGPFWSVVLQFLLATLGVAALSWYAVERPLLARLDRTGAHRPADRDASTVMSSRD